jgi:hypothetical protein
MKRKLKSVKKRSRSKRRIRSKDNGLSKILKKLKIENHENHEENEENEENENIKLLKKILEKIDSIENKQGHKRKKITPEYRRPDYLSYYTWDDPAKYMNIIKNIPTTTDIPSSANLVSPTYLNQFQQT